jgi:Flp pilus assembly protein TadD
MGHHVTTGAAPGYVDSKLCGLCHQDRYASYQSVGMARSLFAASRVASGERRIEDFSAGPYYHEPSRRYYEIEPRGSELIFHRWQTGPDGEPIHEIEIPIDWVLGSGNHSRVYLYRTPTGKLFQLPLAWYSQEDDGRGGWFMAPGFDASDHQGVLRRVRRECMFCHNAYPDVPAGSDGFAADHTFPAALPEGTGCQRCHGPGAEHVRRALSPEGISETIRAAIVNPARLAPELQSSVCYECHMEPSVAFPGLRRFGRGDYSFRPGQLLDDYRVQLEVTEEGGPPGGRFEINHHPYRLEQSRCFEGSGMKLSCLTCHDPHRKVPPEERAAHYRAACLTCHQDGIASHPAVAKDGGAASAEAPAVDVLASDCTACHMPTRRPADVVHVVMTDHRIVRRAEPAAQRLAPREEADPVITGLDFLRPAHSPEGALGEVYRAAAVVRGVPGSADALEHLARNLDRARPEDPEPWLDLAEGRLQGGRFAAAETTLREVLSRPDLAPAAHLQALGWLAVARSGEGHDEEAIALLREVLADDPEALEARVNLGRLLLVTGKAAEAVEQLRRTVDLQPNQVTAWELLGEALLGLERPAEAAEAFRRTLALDPTRTASYLRLADALTALDRRGEAIRYLRHGAVVAARPEEVRKKLLGLP